MYIRTFPATFLSHVYHHVLCMYYVHMYINMHMYVLVSMLKGKETKHFSYIRMQ